MTPATAYLFGPCRFVPALRTLQSGDQPVKLGGRAMDMLLALLERRNRVVGKNELLDLVWPGLVVEENNLQVQVSTLRKLLGHQAIATVPGRGYRFTLPVRIEGDPGAGAPPPPPPRPDDASELIGRDAELRELEALLEAHGLVTLAGTGGIGKSRLAQGVARARADAREVCWVELAPLADPALIAGAVGRALGVTLDGAADPTSAVIAALRGRTALLVLDNAEHLLDGVAAFVGAVRTQAPSIKLLVTSQEVLRTLGEHVFRAAPLGLPEGDDLAAASTSGAVALFVARARAADPRFRLVGANVGAVVDICRRLDGIPLAIEFAAARLPLLGVEGLRSRLDERFNVLTAGARVAMRRHQTLRAALTWSHGLLTEPEQRVYRRLGAFVGGFTLEAAQHAASDDDIDPWDVLEHLGSLVDKSLVLAEGEGVPRYRMLETTRLFALERLADANETEPQLRRHAQAMVATIAARSGGIKRWSSTREEFDADAVEVDNARAALDWASRSDDVKLAVEVAAHCGIAFIRADLLGEYFGRALPLRARVTSGLPPDVEALYWLRLAATGTKVGRAESLEAALRAIDLFRALKEDQHLLEALVCAILIGSVRADAPDLQPLVDEALALEQTGWPPALRSYLRWGLYRFAQREGRHEEALHHAQEQAALSAQRDPVFTLRLSGANVADCEIALGRHAQAEAHARAALKTLAEAGIHDARVGQIHAALALALIMQDRYEQAAPVARDAWHRLQMDGDELRLLEPLALAAARQGRGSAAARIAGHVDATLRASGTLRWPAAAQRRAQLDALLADAMAPAELAQHLAAGAAATRAEALALALDDVPGPTLPSDERANL